MLVPLLNQFGTGGPNTMLSVAVLFAAAAAIWFNLAEIARRGRLVSVGVALAVTLLVIVNNKTSSIDVRYAKGQKLQHEKFVRWNSFSRIALGEERDYHTPMIFIDADASTGIAQFDFDHLSGAATGTSCCDEGPGTALRAPARRQDADHRAGRRLGCRARAGFGQPRCYRRRDQSDHRRRPSCGRSFRS